MVFIIERDKNKNESLRNAVKFAVEDVRDDFAAQMSDLASATAGHGKLAQKQVAGEVLKVAEEIAASTRDRLADRLIRDVPRKMNATSQ